MARSTVAATMTGQDDAPDLLPRAVWGGPGSQRALASLGARLCAAQRRHGRRHGCALLRWNLACLPLPRIIVTLYHAVASRLVRVCPRTPASLAHPKAADKA
jgi:hypothetical protein